MLFGISKSLYDACWKASYELEAMHTVLRRLMREGKLPKFSGIFNCRYRAIPEFRYGKPTGFHNTIELLRTEDDKGNIISSHRIYGDRRCKNLFICPRCASTYGARVNEVLSFSVNQFLKDGYFCFMMTLTVRHTREMSLESIASGFQQARRYFTSHRTWKNIKKELGIIGCVTSLEITDDAPNSQKKTGWHWHTHTLVFYKPVNENFRGWFTDEYAKSIELKIKELWKKSLNSYNLDCTYENGVDITLPRKENVKKQSDACFGTNSINDASALQAAKYISKALSWEITGSLNFTKVGRKSNRISTWDMLRLITEGDMSLLSRYAEFMLVIKGKRFITWTPGLKCVLPEDEEELKKTVSVFTWEEEEYAPLVKYTRISFCRRKADEAGSNASKAVNEVMTLVKQGIDPETGGDLVELKFLQ